MQRVEGAGVELACSARGTGTPVLVVHGIASDSRDWAQFAGVLERSARLVLYDRRGYGDSGAPEPYAGTTVEEQAQDAAAVLAAVCEEPAVVVGDGLGALVCLDLAKRHRSLVRGLVLHEPPLFAFVAEATEALAAERLAIEEALRDGGPEAAVRAWLSTQGAGTGERAARAHRAFFADYAGLATWPVTRGELRALDVPAVVVTGPGTAAHVAAAAGALAGLLPDVQRAEDGDLVAATLRLLG